MSMFLFCTMYFFFFSIKRSMVKMFKKRRCHGISFQVPSRLHSCLEHISHSLLGEYVLYLRIPVIWFWYLNQHSSRRLISSVDIFVLPIPLSVYRNGYFGCYPSLIRTHPLICVKVETFHGRMCCGCGTVNHPTSHFLIQWTTCEFTGCSKRNYIISK